MSKYKNVLAERLADATGFEMYRFINAADDEPIATIALKPNPETRTVDYGIWRVGEDNLEPNATGSVECLEETWGDKAREDAIRRIAYHYEDNLHFSEDDLEVLLGETLANDEDESDEKDEDNEDDEDDEDEDDNDGDT